MITTSLSAVIGAKRERVWRALTVPDEVLRWDNRVITLLDPAADYPRAGQRVRWTYRIGKISLTLRDAPVEVVPPERLRSALALGPIRFEAAYTLADEVGETNRTRFAVKLITSNSVPVLGAEVDRFEVRRVAAEFVDARVRAIQSWCERNP